ncbi:LysR family transcriptional regulator [Streptomyces sp. NPDC053499]|uniref:LysR family transcriptional regulator n=1 Tax=Streptomyces sp. NPDC053499 TaxID=3365707 RepID=UPI0037D55758
MIDLRLLHTLRVLRSEGTVTATARALHLSPSAVSQQLRQLAQQTGAELLRPEGRVLRLTPAGRVLLRHADVLLAQWEQARAELSEQGNGTERTLRVEGFVTTMASLLAPMASELLRARPPVRVVIHEADTRLGYQRLLADQSDISVVTPHPDSPTADDPRFEQRPLMDDFLDLVVPAGHPLAGRGPVDLAAAAEEDWITPHHDQDRLIQALCAAAGFAPRRSHHSNEWPAVLSMIGHGLGVCLVPRLMSLDGFPQVVRVPVQGSPPPLRRVLTVVRRGSAGQAVVAAGLAALRARAEVLTQRAAGK